MILPRVQNQARLSAVAFRKQSIASMRRTPPARAITVGGIAILQGSETAYGSDQATGNAAQRGDNKSHSG